MADERKYTLEDYLRYQSEIEAADNASEDEGKILYNDSPIHASLLFAQLLKVKDGKPAGVANMYCGKFSIFRDKFKTVVAEALKDIENKDNNFTPYESSVNALVTFLKLNGEINVITDEDIYHEIQGEELWEKIKSYCDKKVLKFHLRDKNTDNLPHFTVVNNKKYRVENDNEKKTALCCFNAEGTASVLNRCFNVLKTESKPQLFS